MQRDSQVYSGGSDLEALQRGLGRIVDSPVRSALISTSNASRRLRTISSNEGVRGRRLGTPGLIANLPEIPGGRGCALDDFPRN